ncbi:hypothetical protein GALL_409080 [mine drainage metagenome]|uniref:Uncharacterized protein n=1 Tax=mine drainage metagenome TaxID=410659 RepID=A0A1J5QBV8_9ZZZZ
MCLARGVADFVDDCGADVLQMPLARAGDRRTQVAIETAQGGGLRLLESGGFRRAEILHVEYAQFGELDLQALRAVAQLAVGADRAGQIECLVTGALHRPRLEEEFGTAICEAGLEDGHAIDGQRLVDADHRRKTLPCLGVGNHHVAGEQPRHAGGIEIDMEFLEVDIERQRLQQHAVAEAEYGHIRFAALGNLQIAAERRVVDRELVDLGNLRNQHVRLERLLAEHPHLRLDHHVAVEQRTQADEHERGMRQDVADAVDAAGLGCDHGGVGVALPRCGAFLHAKLVALAAQHAGEAIDHGGAAFDQADFRAFMEGAHALLAHAFLVGFQVGDDLGGIADQAQAGGHDQKGQDQQEPPRRIDVVELELAEHVGPERAELVDIVVVRLPLGEHGADDAGDGHDHQQGDGEAHRRQQLDESAPGARPVLKFPAGSAQRRVGNGRWGGGHTVMESGRRKAGAARKTAAGGQDGFGALRRG